MVALLGSRAANPFLLGGDVGDMVDLIGHVGMALLWLAPAWYFLDDRRTTLTFLAASVWFGLSPDADLVFADYVGTVYHHGMFHTVVAVTLVAAVLGPVVGRILKRTVGGTKWFSERASHDAVAVGTIGLWVAGLSHLFGDMLSMDDVAPAVKPFWPVYDGRIVIEVFWYESLAATWGLLAAGVAVNAALWVWKGQQDSAEKSTAAGESATAEESVVEKAPAAEH